MVLAGNIFCFIISIIETFGIVGLWLGWGQMTAIFKENGLYVDYCNTNITGDIIDCDGRDTLFNNIYTMTGIIMSVFSFGAGIMQDRYGLFVIRLFAIFATAIGLTSMIFVEDLEMLVWAGWPFIAIGGIINHLANIKMTQSTPSWKGTFMAVLAGSRVFG